MKVAAGELDQVEEISVTGTYLALAVPTAAFALPVPPQGGELGRTGTTRPGGRCSPGIGQLGVDPRIARR